MTTLPTVKLYNTMSRSIEELKPLTAGEVKLYCCGPTVYNYQHIGNLRSYLFQDLLVRTLVGAGYRVVHAMNITDVGHLVSDADEGEDKMAVAMKREKKRSHEIAEYYTKVFFEHCEALNVNRPDIVCPATDHIEQMIALIKRMEERGCTYEANGNVYFDIRKAINYGHLARLDLEKLKAGARIEVDPHKRNPQDFVLWFTKSKFENQELQWDSPWGRGYPGWHLECSAMSIHYLGERFDIHCGGMDHIPVHHTNEIAQSEGATGVSPWVSIWMHGAFLIDSAGKMSKSKGGFLTLDRVGEEGIEPLAYRFMCQGAHYRSELNFSWDALRSSQQSLDKLRKNVLELKSAAEDPTADLSPAGLELQQRFLAALRNDLNAPQAIAEVWALVNHETISPSEKLLLLETVDEHLGLDLLSWEAKEVQVPQEVLELLNRRQTARAEKNWEEADRCRDEITRLGFVIEDTPEGPKVLPKQ